MRREDRFQSHLGLISFGSLQELLLGNDVFQSHLGLISFRGRRRDRGSGEGFQSHLGLISSTKWIRRLSEQRIEQISIPPWSDFFSSTNIRCIVKTSRTISIPPWSDFFAFAIFVTIFASSLTQISIPPWSDFFVRGRQRLCVRLPVKFQSHLGLISSYALAPPH